MLECVVNISEGQRRDVVEELARACGPALLDVHSDPDHHRSVFTIASLEPALTEAGARRLATAAAARLSVADHQGAHPRLGVIDVVPFVALAPTPMSVSVDAAHAFARWVVAELGAPVFLYDLADAERRTLPSVRRDAFTTRRPDAGPAEPHPRLGAVAVGARPVLIAINVELDNDDVVLARTVAQQLRERDGGLPGVRALGIELPSRARAQVSMNLVDLEATGLEAACIAARARVEALGGRVARIELVGLAPAAALATCSPGFLTWSRLSPDDSIEGRVSARVDPGASGEDAAGATPGAAPAPPA